MIGFVPLPVHPANPFCPEGSRGCVLRDRPDAVVELLLGFLAELEAGRDARTA